MIHGSHRTNGLLLGPAIADDEGKRSEQLRVVQHLIESDHDKEVMPVLLGIEARCYPARNRVRNEVGYQSHRKEYGEPVPCTLSWEQVPSWDCRRNQDRHAERIGDDVPS